MKRFHVHISVENLRQSIEFYSALFAARPTVEKQDYAKWMLDDPRVNLAISARGHTTGVNHLGIQADSADELRDLEENLLLVFRESAAIHLYLNNMVHGMDIV